MGPEDRGKEPVKLYMMVDGEPVEINPSFAEIAFHEDWQENGISVLEKREFSMRMKCQKSMRCRSRKRFVKLLMASGVSRNMAQKVFARVVIRRNQNGIVWLKTSYQECFIDLWLMGLRKTRK